MFDKPSPRDGSLAQRSGTNELSSSWCMRDLGGFSYAGSIFSAHLLSISLRSLIRGVNHEHDGRRWIREADDWIARFVFLSGFFSNYLPLYFSPFNLLGVCDEELRIIFLSLCLCFRHLFSFHTIDIAVRRICISLMKNDHFFFATSNRVFFFMTYRASRMSDKLFAFLCRVIYKFCLMNL